MAFFLKKKKNQQQKTKLTYSKHFWHTKNKVINDPTGCFSLSTTRVKYPYITHLHWLHIYHSTSCAYLIQCTCMYSNDQQYACQLDSYRGWGLGQLVEWWGHHNVRAVHLYSCTCSSASSSQSVSHIHTHSLTHSGTHSLSLSKLVEARCKSVNHQQLIDHYLNINWAATN